MVEVAPGSGGYTGVDNLEVMAGAVKYRRYLARCVTSVAGPPAPHQRLLDFGAGTGTHCADLAALGYRVHCVELDPDLRAGLDRAGFPASEDVDHLGGETFDVTYTFNVLEHIDRDDEAIAALFRATRPGGHVVVYVPAFSCLYSAMDRKVGHLRRYRRRSMTALAEEAGFAVERCSYVDSIGFVASLAYKAFGNDRGDIDGTAVRAYDRFVFPVSRLIDQLLGRVVGKNLVLVARRP